MTTMITDRIHLDRTRIKDLEDALANSSALQAAVGAGDLAVEKIRAVREELVNRTMTFDSKTFRDQAQATFIERIQAIQAEVMTAPEQVMALPERAQEWPAKAQSMFADVVSAAFSTYGELASRGKTIVTQVRRDLPAVDEVVPVSRPTTSTGTSSTTTTTTTSKTATKKPATKKTAAKKTTTTKTTTAKRPARKVTTAKATTSKTTTATAKKTVTPATKSAGTRG